MNETALLAEVNAWPAPEQRPVWSRDEWQAVAERIIRQTILDSWGFPRWYLLRLLLHRVPFHLDQPEFKAIWYREQRRQLNLPEPELDEDSESSPAATAEQRAGIVRKLKPIVPLAEFGATSKRILQDFLEEHPTWRSYGESKMVPFFTELRTRLPFEMDPADRPEHQAEWERLQFQQVWYQECATQFGFVSSTELKRRAVEAAAPEVALVAAPKSRQKTLF